MKKKSDFPKIISDETLPEKYLSAPVADAYHPELQEFYFSRRSSDKFLNEKISPIGEKFYRLYFYQGLSQADRMYIHQQYLETKRKKLTCTGIVLGTGMISFYSASFMPRYENSKTIKSIIGLAAGYISYVLFKMYAMHQLDDATDHLYQKYAIR